MKRSSGLMKFTSIIVLVMFFGAGLISCGGGGGGSSVVPIASKAKATELESADDAGEAQQAALDTSSVGSVMTNEVNAFIVAAVPSYTSTPSMKMATSASTDKLASVDPKLKESIDRMLQQLHAPALQNAASKVQKTGANFAPLPTTIPCDSGDILVSDATTSTDTYTVFDVTYTFNTCRDNTANTELTGSVRDYTKLDSSGITFRETANITGKTYTTGFGSVTETNELNVTLSGDMSGSETGTTMTTGVNGSFKTTMAATGEVDTLRFNNLSSAMTVAMDTETTMTFTTSMNGGFGSSSTVGNTVNSDLSVSYSNLVMKMKSGTVADTRQEWINGRVTIDRTPDLEGCTNEGVFDFTTPVDKPLVYAFASSCPASGTLKVNNATIVFGTPIMVTVGTQAAVEYTDCTALAGSSCGM